MTDEKGYKHAEGEEGGVSSLHIRNAENGKGMKEIKDIETLKAFIEDYERLRRITKSLHRYYEARCNGDLTERQERRIEKLEKEAKDIAETWGLYIDICTDPRGATICLHDDAEKLAYWRYSGLVIR